MNEQHRDDCDRFEAMMTASCDDDGLVASDRQALTAHLAACASCRESFDVAAQMEKVLVSRRAEVPAVDAFLPRVAAARARASTRFAHPRLVAAFRAMMSPAGIAITLVMWSTMLAYHFRNPIAGVFELSSSERLSSLLRDVTGPLLGVTGGDAYALVAIYVALALVVLGSTGAITMKYIRQS